MQSSFIDRALLNQLDHYLIQRLSHFTPFATYYDYLWFIDELLNTGEISLIGTQVCRKYNSGKYRFANGIILFMCMNKYIN